MYISKISLHNFKGFKGDHELVFNKGVNFLVGDNNCGKSSILEAVDFIRTKKLKEDIITKTATQEEFVSVEVEFSGDDIETLLDADDLKKYRSALIVENGTKSLRVKRTSDDDIGKVYFFKPDTGCYSNLTGVDKTISALFDAQIVWADADSSDVSDFSKTKICGKIINAITKEFVHTETWRRFKKSHQETFGDGEKSLATTLKPIEEKITTLLSEQYGETEVRFSFTLPELDNFFKTGSIALSDNGLETKSIEKGTGMQRALALALIQVYAELSSSTEESGLNNHIFS